MANNFFIAELSSLNVFHASEDGLRVYLSTATDDIPGPIFAFDDVVYPKRRTSQRFQLPERRCEHSYEYLETRQLRRGDEAPSIVRRCSKCKHIEIN